MAIRVLLVDDHRILRDALRLALAREEGIEVVAEAGTAAEALDSAAALRPDVVVLDIGLPDLSGLEVAARLRRLPQPPQVVALSAQTDKRFVSEMLRSGAQAYVTKSSAAEQLVRAVRAVAAGSSYLCPEVADALVSEVRALGRDRREAAHLAGHRRRAPPQHHAQARPAQRRRADALRGARGHRRALTLPTTGKPVASAGGGGHWVAAPAPIE